jgi:hypothetical protein
MTEILSGIFGAIVGGCFTFCLSAVIFASSRESREEEIYGAPEGASLFNHFQCPDASGLKLSVRASYQSVRSVDG